MKKRKMLLLMALLLFFLGVGGYQSKVQAASTKTMYVVNCDEWISLRSSASTSAKRLKKMPLGASCKYLSSAKNGFYKVKYNGTVGYALSKYLSTKKTVSKTKPICVTKIKGNYVYYYNCKVKIETPVIQGKQYKAKITDKTKYYCYTSSQEYSPFVWPKKVSKTTFIKYINRAKKYNKKGFYIYGTFQGDKCVKLEEPYWP